jgi:hypothetical protein
MIIFPEGKTQKFCRITIKIFIMIYILDNIFLNGSIDLNLLKDMSMNVSTYEREVSISSIDEDFIDSINENQFEGDDVVKNITLNFTEDMNVKAVVILNKLLSIDEINKLKTDVAEIFQISSDNIDIQ